MLLHRALYRRNIATGFVHPEDDLSRLKMLYVPHWLMWDERWSDAVRAFVEGGGLLLASAMTGTRTRDNHILRELAPGMGLGELLGVRVEEFGRLAAPGADGLFQPPGQPMGLGAGEARLPAGSTGRRYLVRYGNGTFPAAHLYERLITGDDVEPLATWSDCWLEEQPVLTRRAIGKGAGHYLGTYLTEPLVERLIERLIEPAGIGPVLPDLPAGIEASERNAPDGRRLIFVLNTTNAPVEITLPEGSEDLLSGTVVSGRSTLEAHGALVLDG